MKELAMSNKTNSLFDAETLLKSMNLTMVAETQKQNAETARQVSAMVSESLNMMASRQAQMAQQSIAETMEAVRDMSGSNDVDEYMNKQTTAMRTMAKHMQQNTRELTEIMTKTQTTAWSIFGAQMQQNWQQFSSEAERTMKSATSATTAKK